MDGQAAVVQGPRRHDEAVAGVLRVREVDLPNGTYYVQVTANPEGHLYESNVNNNISLRQVILGGSPGARTVTVPRGRNRASTAALPRWSPARPATWHRRRAFPASL